LALFAIATALFYRWASANNDFFRIGASPMKSQCSTWATWPACSYGREPCWT